MATKRTVANKPTAKKKVTKKPTKKAIGKEFVVTTDASGNVKKIKPIK